jgi:hypothetical protein
VHFNEFDMRRTAFLVLAVGVFAILFSFARCFDAYDTTVDWVLAFLTPGLVFLDKDNRQNFAVAWYWRLLRA